MTRKFILLLATLSLLTTLPACTSGDSKGEEEVIAEDGTSEDLAGLAEDGGSSSGNLDESLDGEQTADTTVNPDALTTDTAQTTTEDQLTIDSFGENSADSNAAITEPVPEPTAPELEPAPPTTTDIASNDLSTGAEEITPPTTTETPAEQPMTAATTDLDQPKPAQKSLQKVASSPWKMGSKWVNAIYFARPGDSLDSISQTIYGDDRTKELKKINPTYNNRDVKPGDKVYYASVVRPDDSEKIVTFFEEKNVPSKSYVAKPGDNIRKLSQELLGYPEAWKEVWAYNMVESKQEIPEGTELRYWDSSAVAMATGGGSNDIASNNNHMGMNQAPPPMENHTPPPMDPSSNMAPPPMDSMAQNDLPPPPPNDLPPPPDMGMNQADLPPPPPPPADIPPPPPPPMETAAPPAVAQTEETGTGMAEEDQTLAMGAVAAAVLGGLALVIVRRKRKQKEMEQALGETHVG